MPKKTTPAAMPDQPLRKEAVNPEAFVGAMRRLSANPDFLLLRRYWAGERIGILEDGKRKPSLDAWSELKGFDRAIIVVEVWAHKQTGDDLMKQRHDALMESLHGEKQK